jgi:hypothetical protein
MRFSLKCIDEISNGQWMYIRAYFVWNLVIDLSFEISSFEFLFYSAFPRKNDRISNASTTDVTSTNTRSFW